jgi:hypothetical protein
MAPSAQNVGLLASVGATVRLTPPGLAGFGIQITGTWAGTVQFEGSIDGVTFTALSATPIAGTVSVVQTTVNGLWQAAAPLVSMQVRMSAWTSGQAVVTLNAVEAATGGAAAAGGGSGGGAVSIADAATGSTTDPAVVGDNPGTVNSHLRGLDKITADVWDSVNHRLHVNVDNSASIGGGTQYTEDAPAAGDPTGTALILVRADTPAATVTTNGDNIAQRGTNFGAAYVTLLDAAGTAVSVSGGTQATEDVPALADPIGNMLMARRQDILTTSQVSADGDNIALNATNKGQLYVSVPDGVGVNWSGTAAVTGHGTAASALRVELPTDGTGVVGLNAGTNVIGHVIVDSGTVSTISNVVHVDDNAASLSVDWNGTQPVTGHGVATGALRVELPTDGTGLVNVAQAVAASLNATVIGAGVAGTPAGGVVTVQGAASMTKLLVTPDSVALPANQSVNLAQVGGQTTATAGVNGTLAVGGNVANNVAIGSNPINNGAQAVSAENSAVTTGRMVQLVADLVGKLIVLPYANPENFVSGVTAGQMTATTSTTCVAAPAAGLRNYITTITVSNSDATHPTDVLIQDGSSGTTLWVVPAAAAQGGAVVTFPTPLRQPTTATAIFVQNVTTSASTKVSIAGYKGA